MQENKKINITVDREKCIGCGTCVNLCPSHFELIEGKSSPKTNSDCSDCDLTEVAESCPVEAIVIAEEK